MPSFALRKGAKPVVPISWVWDGRGDKMHANILLCMKHEPVPNRCWYWLWVLVSRLVRICGGSCLLQDWRARWSRLLSGAIHVLERSLPYADLSTFRWPNVFKFASLQEETYVSKYCGTLWFPLKPTCRVPSYTAPHPLGVWRPRSRGIRSSTS